jgi:hypothetical protein
MDSQRLRFVATGLAWIVGFAVALGTLVALLGGGLVGVGVSLAVSLGAASILYFLWPYFAQKPQPSVPSKVPTIFSLPTPETPDKKSNPVLPSRVRVCHHGPYKVRPGEYIQVPLTVKGGDVIEGHLVEKDNWDFDWFIVDDTNLVRYINRDPKLYPLDAGDHAAAYDIRRTIPRDGSWYLLLDVYQRQNYRDVEVNLFKAA